MVVKTIIHQTNIQANKFPEITISDTQQPECYFPTHTITDSYQMTTEQSVILPCIWEILV